MVSICYLSTIIDEEMSLAMATKYDYQQLFIMNDGNQYWLTTMVISNDQQGPSKAGMLSWETISYIISSNAGGFSSKGLVVL